MRSTSPPPGSFLRYTCPPPGRSRKAIPPAARRSFSEGDMNQSSAACAIGRMRCSMRNVVSISFRRPCQSGTSFAPMILSARSNAGPALVLCVSACTLRHHLVREVHEPHERRRRRQHEEEVEAKEESKHVRSRSGAGHRSTMPQQASECCDAAGARVRAGVFFPFRPTHGDPQSHRPRLCRSVPEVIPDRKFTRPKRKNKHPTHPLRLAAPLTHRRQTGTRASAPS